MIPSADVCLRAVRGRDTRFDGVFVNAVRSTGIYCRPSCPAVTPNLVNMAFYPTAAAAQDAGYRACRRCRPDATPGSPAWDIRADVVARAMRLVRDGVVDRHGVTGLADRLGYSVRQLQRLMTAELGAGPLAISRSQRAQTARVLIEATAMAFSDVAFAAGFGSVRSFNEAVQIAFALTPRELRARRTAAATRDSAPALGAIRLRLPFRTPFNPANVFGHLAATAVPGVEEWRAGAYRRTMRLPHGHGVVALSPALHHVDATLWLADTRDLAPAIGRCRRLLDLDADPVAVDEALAADPVLAPLVAGAPGRRVPRTVDPDEFALRAVLGQQISTARAATLTAALVERLGEQIEDPAGGLTHLFPSMAAIAALDPTTLPMPRSRGRTLVRLASALADGTLDLTLGSDWTAARAGLIALPGIGPWTVEMVAMRSLGDPDAFPATDLGIAKGLAYVGGADPEAWRPWRSYAAQYLWATSDHPINHLPEETP